MILAGGDAGRGDQRLDAAAGRRRDGAEHAERQWRRAPDGPAAARRARSVRARISAWRRSTASAATSRAPPSSSAWSARRCTASSRRWESGSRDRSDVRMPHVARIAYVNGRYRAARAGAQCHVEDRGYQFADGVYEVCEVRGGRLVDERRHMDAARALAERTAHRACRCRARARRRAARDRARATACATASSICRSRAASRGATTPFRPPARRRASSSRRKNYDLRQAGAAAPPTASRSSPCRTTAGRASTSSRSALLPNVLAKQAAREQGAREAWFVDATGFVTEGSSTNAWIVTRDGTLVTRPADLGILRGITRTVRARGHRASTGSSSRSAPSRSRRPMRRARPSSPRRRQFVMPVVRIDGRRSATARPGLIATALRRDYHDHAEIA